VRACCLSLDVLSAHADRQELLRWLHSGPALPQTTFLTHGEPASTQALAHRLHSEGLNVIVPQLGDVFDYDFSLRRWQPAR
jgi:metallo-beta-lactamase family protein